jgi:hypothetical protein
MNTLFKLKHSLKKGLIKIVGGKMQKKNQFKNRQAIDWISDTLISAGVYIIKSDKTNSYSHEKNSI